MKNFIKTNKKQKGFTVIELGVGIVTLMILAGWVLSKIIMPFMGKRDVAETSMDVKSIIMGSLDWGLGKEDGFKELTVEKLSDHTYVSADFGDGTGKTPWGGDYTAGPDATDDFILKVTVTDMPAEACNRLADKSPQATCSSTTVTYKVPVT